MDIEKTSPNPRQKWSREARRGEVRVPQCRITYLSKKDFESHICSAVVQSGWQRRPSKFRHNKLIRSIPDPRMETAPSRDVTPSHSHDVNPSHNATPSHDVNQFIEINKMSPLQRFPTRSVIQPTAVTSNPEGRAPRRDFLEIPDWRVGFNLSYTCQRCGEPFHESEEWQTILITHLCPF